ncbi:MAG: GntR family transcriptional regulator [Burkholderiaceae bacterium]|nr:GntR family transcriptional regulator [Burkholderiaceae bacterium]
MASAMPLPKYHQLYLVLREQLAEGRHDAGLPGELALADQFGVARVTVRKALERLAAEGLIARTPGRGTVPVKHGAPPPPPEQAQLTGLLENIVSMGLRTAVKVLACDVVPAPEAVARPLALPTGAPVQKAVRVRSTREGPLSHITTWVPEPLARGFGRRELARQPILLLLEGQGVRIGRAEQAIGARLADADVARHLQVDVGSALLAVQRLIFDADDRPVQWLQGLYRPDRYQYQMQLSRVGTVDAKVWVSTALTAQFH